MNYFSGREQRLPGGLDKAQNHRERGAIVRGADMLYADPEPLVPLISWSDRGHVLAEHTRSGWQRGGEKGAISGNPDLNERTLANEAKVLPSAIFDLHLSFLFLEIGLVAVV
ncbi:hypothetical protein ACOMHN_058176 [Nucella lapillus]